MTHAADLLSYEQAISSGTDGIQHVPADGLLNSTLLSTIRSQGQTITPTINIFQYEFSEPALFNFLNPFSNATAGSLSIVLQNAALAYQAGVTILAGTDAVGTLGNITIPFGITLHQELQNLVQIGMTPAEALRAATGVPAAFLRFDDRGVIAPGKRADLVLLNSNPLESINNTLDIAEVWVGGVQTSAVAGNNATNSTGSTAGNSPSPTIGPVPTSAPAISRASGDGRTHLGITGFCLQVVVLSLLALSF